MKNTSLQSILPPSVLSAPTGTVWVYRTLSVGQFSWDKTTPLEVAYERAFEFRASHRRAEKCSIWVQADGGDCFEVSAAGEAAATTTSSPKKARESSGGSRKERREKRKVDLIAVREKIQNQPLNVIAFSATEDECAITRRESFKEVRARVSQKKSLRKTYWKAKGVIVATGLGVAAFR